VCLIGAVAGILVQSHFFQTRQTPFYFENQGQTVNLSADSTYSFQIRQINDQQLTNSRQTVITKAVKMASPAVVGINVLQVAYRTPPYFMDDPFFRHFFPERQQYVKGLGSGFVISPDGYIVSNEHVIHKAVKIMVTFPDGKKYDARIIALDYISDIALLKVDADHPFQFIPLGNSDDLIIGEWAIALGNPFGLFDMGQPSVSQGIISATDRDFGKQKDNRIYKDMIQTDAAINSGNSGGPLVNSVGEVIGMNTFIFSGSASSGTSIGLGFAIPINRVKNIITELRKYGAVDRTFRTGLSVINLTPAIASYLGIKLTQGVIIASVESDSPASEAGLQVGDIIIQINDYDVKSTSQIDRIFDDLDAKAGDVLKLKVYRDNKEFLKYLKLQKHR
ncbi:MAG: trypsin-like peptidase domain-containing protein, partial [bacterium]|nr:trypsin-like peptidase domain-containing protein [bacterium]